jgi:hypothetical protein
LTFVKRLKGLVLTLGGRIAQRDDLPDHGGAGCCTTQGEHRRRVV